eukprot:5406680-Amphidinium_carterae.1
MAQVLRTSAHHVNIMPETISFKAPNYHHPPNVMEQHLPHHHESEQTRSSTFTAASFRVAKVCSTH